MRTLLLASALLLAASPAWAKVIMNSFDEDGAANARAELRAKAEAAGEPIPPEAQEYQPPQNAWSAAWAAAQSRVNEAMAGTEERLQKNKVNKARQELAKAQRKGKPEAIEAALAKVAEEEAKLAELSKVTENYSISTTEHWGTAKEFTHNAMKPVEDREQPIAGFEDDDK